MLFDQIMYIYICMNKNKNKNPFDFFDAIYCINLDHRTDRWEHAQKEFEKLGIKDRVIRFSAIKHNDGRIGVIRSNLEIFKIAKKRNYKNILIFEDDVEFLMKNKPLETLDKSLNQLPKNVWGMIYLGANTHQPLIKTNKPNLTILKNAYAAHAICYHQKIYDVIINQFSKISNKGKITTQQDILDVFLAKLQERYHTFLITPMIATQYANFSDIEKQNVNYSFIEERYKKHIK